MVTLLKGRLRQNGWWPPMAGTLAQGQLGVWKPAREEAIGADTAADRPGVRGAAGRHRPRVEAESGGPGQHSRSVVVVTVRPGATVRLRLTCLPR